MEYEFGGGKPDPGSFPYDEIVDATARMMKIEGDQALTYGEPLGYRGLRELLAHKYDHFENLQVSPDSFLLTNGSSHALSLAISMFVDIGDPVICEAPTFSGTEDRIETPGAVTSGFIASESGAGPLDEKPAIASVFVAAAAVIASGALPGVLTEPRPTSSKSFPAATTGTTPAFAAPSTAPSTMLRLGSTSISPSDMLITSMPSLTAASIAATRPVAFSTSAKSPMFSAIAL